MTHFLARPVVWSIAASDSGGGAGIQADLNTQHSLGCHSCNIITAITAQNSLGVAKVSPVAEADLDAQWQALETDIPAKAIKIGLLAQPSTITWLTKRLTQLKKTKHPVICIWDPVLKSSTGATLLESCSQQLIDPLLCQLDLITPNLSEAEELTGTAINSFSDIERAAQLLLERGVNNVLIKGGHTFAAQVSHCHDYFASQERCFWLSHKKQNQPNSHGTGCTLASAIASFIAHGRTLSDSLVLANRYIQQSLRLAAPQGQGAGPVWQSASQNNPKDFSELTLSATYFQHDNKQQLQNTDGIKGDIKGYIKASNLGLYAIVDNLNDLQRLIDQGVDTLQWRVKSCSRNEAASNEHKERLKQAINLCEQAQVPLYINDDWQLALEYNAYGIHLGQEDLENINHAQLNQIKDQGIRLGISCHNETELAFAHSLKPSYLAFGPVFTAKSKIVDHPNLGLNTLRQWQKSYGQIYPTTCIGGIDLNNLKDVLATGIRSIAVISALNDPQASLLFIEAFAEFSVKDPR